MSCDSCIAASSRKSACSGHKGCQASFVVSCQVKRTSLHKHSLVKTASPILARRDRGLTLKSWPKNVPRKQKTRQNELPWPRRHQQCAAYLASLLNPTSDAQVMIQHIYEQSVHMHSRHCGISCCVLLSLPELQLAKHWNERMSSTHCHSDIKHYLAGSLKFGSYTRKPVFGAHAFCLFTIHLLGLLAFSIWTKQQNCLTVKGLR